MLSWVLFQENLKIAWQAIKSNRLRTILTISIIAFGIMALVGILTAIDAIKNSLNEQFAIMGTNTFQISNRTMKVRIGKHGRARYYENISYRQAEKFKASFDFPAWVSIQMYATGRGTIKYGSYKSNPNVTVIGADENYLKCSGNTIAQGHFFTQKDLTGGSNVVVIGANVANHTFDNKENPINKMISVGNQKYRVVGVFKSKGNSITDRTDDQCLVPLLVARNNFYSSDISYTINVTPKNLAIMDLAVNEAEAQMRKVKKLKINEDNNFQIDKSDNLANMLFENIKYVTISATIIGLITLLGAAVGLMNIILVSVTERTREIGVRKALGATPKTIKQQFLFEAVFIGQLGGILGIVFGIIIGNVVSIFTGTGFIIPWLWILLGVFLCFVVGLASGITPAVKASKLDPIIALHYE